MFSLTLNTGRSWGNLIVWEEYAGYVDMGKVAMDPMWEEKEKILMQAPIGK